MGVKKPTGINASEGAILITNCWRRSRRLTRGRDQKSTPHSPPAKRSVQWNDVFGRGPVEACRPSAAARLRAYLIDPSIVFADQPDTFGMRFDGGQFFGPPQAVIHQHLDGVGVDLIVLRFNDVSGVGAIQIV